MYVFLSNTSGVATRGCSDNTVNYITNNTVSIWFNYLFICSDRNSFSWNKQGTPYVLGF